MLASRTSLPPQHCQQGQPGLLLSQAGPGQVEVGVSASRQQEVVPLPHLLDEVAGVDLPGQTGNVPADLQPGLATPGAPLLAGG